MISRHSQMEVSNECPLISGIVKLASTNFTRQRHKMAETETIDTGELSAPPPASAEPPALVLEPYMRKTYEWRVERCRRLVSATEGAEALQYYFMRSPQFQFMRRTWYIELYPNLPPAMHLYLFLLEGSPPAMVHHSFGIRAIRGDIEWKMDTTCHFGSAGERKISHQTAKTFITKVDLANRMSDLAKDDVLTILCNLFSEESLKFVEGFVYRSEESIPRHLLPESRPWDLTFNVRDRILVADSAILRLHCPNLVSKMEPGNTYLVNYNPRVYRQFLLYFYTGKVVKMDMEELIMLYTLAKWYQVASLRERCLCLMTALMDQENVPALLFADRTTDPDLAAVVQKFLLEHITQVISTPIWMRFLKEKPHEANQVYLLMGEALQGRDPF